MASVSSEREKVACVQAFQRFMREGKGILRGRRFKREGKGILRGRRFKREGKGILRGKRFKREGKGSERHVARSFVEDW